MLLPSDHGRFVSYADHVAEMEKLRESVRRLVGDLTQAKAAADKLVNDGHGAGNYHQVHYNQGKKSAIVWTINHLTAFLDENKELS